MLIINTHHEMNNSFVCIQVQQQGRIRFWLFLMIYLFSIFNVLWLLPISIYWLKKFILIVYVSVYSSSDLESTDIDSELKMTDSASI